MPSSLFAERNYLSLRFLTIFSFVVLLTSKQLVSIKISVYVIYSPYNYYGIYKIPARGIQTFSQIVDDFQKLPEDLSSFVTR